jgi:hypothetical protein
MFENRVLRRILGSKSNKVTGGWTELHNEELHGLYSSQNTIRMTKPRRIRWARHLARMGEMTTAYKILVGIPKGKAPIGNLGIDGRIILKSIMGK